MISSRPSSPIADLSYRNYDGPLESPRFRWWSIARHTMKLGIRNKLLWFSMIFSAGYYFTMIIILFFVGQLATSSPTNLRPGAPNPMEEFLRRIVWKDQFLHGFSFGQLFFLFMILALGAGAIANDNRANALLVYLSKPCTKLDYVLGKFVGIFVPLLLTMLIPSLLFYGYGALSYREYGFISDDPWILPKLFVLFPLSAAFHASMILGVSSLFNQGKIAGAVYAGIYFITNFFTQLMVITWAMMTHGRQSDADPAALDVVSNLFYLSIDGLNIGLAKAILGTDGSPYFGIDNPRAVMVPAPSIWWVLPLMALLGGLSMLLAWKRVRAVEVVGS